MTSDPSAAAEIDAAQRRITAFWDTVSGAYDAQAGNVPPSGSAERAAWIRALAAALGPEPADVLDVGTGTGFLALAAAGLGHRVTGIDLSEPMLALARDATRRDGLDAAFVHGDAVEPPFPSASFDVVMSRSLLWTLRELPRAFANWAGLLRDGGRIVAVYALVAGPLRPAEESKGAFYDAHYTPETRALLPAIELRDHGPLLAAAGSAGLTDVNVTALEAVRAASGSPLHHLLVARRASRRDAAQRSTR